MESHEDITPINGGGCDADLIESDSDYSVYEILEEQSSSPGIMASQTTSAFMTPAGKHTVV
jgi:hypothetical protein